MSEQQFTADEVLMLKALVVGLRGAQGATSSGGNGVCAPDSELDGKYGNEPIRKDPSQKYWTGASMVGARFSECPPEYLDAFAKWKDASAYMNRKENKPEKLKYADYDERDAARARGWAKRLRAGGVAAPAAAPAATSTPATEDPSWVTGDDSFDAGEEDPFE